MSNTRRIERGKGHSYLLDGHKVPGVTSILSSGFPKPALINWAAGTTADYAVNYWDQLAELPVAERLKRLQKCRFEDRDAAANRGTEIHALAERLVHGDEIEVPDELAGHVDTYVKWLDTWQAQPVLVERPIFNRSYWYAGTFDLIADLNDGTRRLIDLKTNRSGPFGDTAYQLCAYANAEVYLDENGAEQPMPAVDGCAVVWIRADGADFYPYRSDAWVLREFRYIQMVAAATEACRDYKLDAIHPGDTP